MAEIKENAYSFDLASKIKKYKLYWSERRTT